ncbi:MAG: hypothetical protein ACPGJV_03890 [Bacteriovoracaceae bacterium]
MIYRLFFILLLLSTTQLAKANNRSIVKVFDIKGESFLFQGRSAPVEKLNEGRILRSGDIIATSNQSTLALDFSGNGIVVLSPNTQVLVNKVTKNHLLHLILIRGEIYFQTKGSAWKSRPPGVIFSVRGYPHGYIGHKYKIRFLPKEQSLVVMDDQIKVYPLNLKDIAPQRSRSKKFIQGFALDQDEDDEWRSLIQEFETDQRKEDLQNQRSWDLKLVTRGVHVEENQFVTTDLFVDNEELGENSIVTDDSLKPKETFYDVRLEWGTRKSKGMGTFITNGWLEYGDQEDQYREPLQFLNDRKDGRSHLQIAELYYQMSGKSNDFTFGKKIIKSGYANLYSILDRITPKDLYDPLDKRDIGNYLVQFDSYFGNWTLSYVLLPYYLPNKAAQRFIADDSGNLIRPNREYPRSKPSTFQHYLKAKTSTSGWDFTFSLFRGPYNSPVYTQTLTGPSDGSNLDCSNANCEIKEIYPIVDRFSFGFSTLFGKINTYFESQYQDADSRRDQTWFKYLIGATWKEGDFEFTPFIDQATYYLEYTKEKIVNEQRTEDINEAINNLGAGETKTIFLEDTSESRDHDHNILFRTVLTFSPKYALTLNYDYSFDLQDLLQIYGIEYTADQNLFIRLHYENYRLNLKTRQNDTSLTTPLGSFNNLSQSTDLKRTFDRYTLTLNYTF